MENRRSKPVIYIQQNKKQNKTVAYRTVDGTYGNEHVRMVAVDGTLPGTAVARTSSSWDENALK